MTYGQLQARWPIEAHSSYAWLCESQTRERITDGLESARQWAFMEHEEERIRFQWPEPLTARSESGHSVTCSAGVFVAFLSSVAEGLWLVPVPLRIMLAALSPYRTLVPEQ